jgi:hypothetical protein
MKFRGVVLVGSALLVGAALHVGCGSDGGDGFDGGGADATSDVAPSGDGGNLVDSPFGGDAGCKASTDCDGGVCMKGGQCCDTAAHVCGSACCGGGTVCLFDSCVVPGNACRSGADCAPNEYCEPALGDNDGGTSDGGLEAGCSEPLPSLGRCLPLPPTCPGDAGTTADGGTCIADCEYHPPPGGLLNAKTKWTWGGSETVSPNAQDVWATPTVGRVYDTNCDGKIDALDSPVIVFVSGDTGTVNCNAANNVNYPNACHNGVLRMVDGRTGTDVWSLAKASSTSLGFMAGLSVATGDVDGDGLMDIVAMTAEGYIVVVDHTGTVKYTSDFPYGTINANTGWGGGLAIADINLDGWPEIAYADTVWTMSGGALKRAWVGGKGTGGTTDQALSAFSDVDQANDGNLELVAGNTAYKSNGQVLWQNTNVNNGFPAVADLDKNGAPEVIVVGNGDVWILNGATGAIITGPFVLPGTGGGGAPTVADFDGDGYPEIGIAQANYYSVVKPTITNNVITGMTLLWKAGNHDFSSSVTGSTVFDFEGDGKAEVIYADECWLWVFDGTNGNVRLAVSHSSFTATEASIVADIDGDGHAEMLIPSQGVDMNNWNCIGYEQGKLSINGQYWTPGPQTNSSYRGLVAIGDTADSWVGTRTLWNEHSYHVSNVCDDSDNACPSPNIYGTIPKGETKNWTLPWLNDFRQNVQDKGIFNAPDAVVSLTADCVNPVVAHVSIRNIGQAGLPAGVVANVYVTPGDILVGTVTTTSPLLPGQTQTIDVTLSSPADKTSSFYAAIYIDPKNPTFHECNDTNDKSDTIQPTCVN